jgi:hypothetical protein
MPVRSILDTNMTDLDPHHFTFAYVFNIYYLYNNYLSTFTVTAVDIFFNASYI